MTKPLDSSRIADGTWLDEAEAMRHLPGLFVASLFASSLVVTGCGGEVVDDFPPIPNPYPGTPNECGGSSKCQPSTPQEPNDTTPSSSDVIGCVTSLDDDFDSGVWSTKWWRLAIADDPANDRLFVPSTTFPDHVHVLQVEGPASSTGYVQSSSPKIHTTCFPKKAHFGFDYRIDEGSLDSSREDHAEIGEVTGLDATGVRCSLPPHEKQGRLRAGGVDKLDLGPIAASTWARIDMTFDGQEATLERDGQPVGAVPMGCVLSDGMVRFGVSGGRSYAPGAYRAYFDNVTYGASSTQ